VKDLFKKFISRKLLVTVLAPLAIARWPFLLPILQWLAPTYVIGQAGVDAVTAWKASK